ncbi:Myb-like DNA-binding domain protein [Linnemannia zychae]|nr:Myb-like DNA-binding domain protein [Linnemannia zychae]
MVEVEKGTMDKKPRLSIQKQAWTEEEDQWLTKRLQEYGLKDREEHEISWPVIANGRVDGKSLGRTATSCKRRWTIIDPSSERHFGYWSQEEKDRLASAIRSQLEEMGSISPEESIKESMTDSTGVRNKLGLTLNGDNLVLIDWDEIGRKVATRSGVQCRSHAFKNLESGLKGRWDEDEVERLTKGIAEYGEDWHKIASVVGTRSAFQSRQKYNTILAKAKQQANQKDK